MTRRRRAADELDDPEFMSWIVRGGGVYLDQPAHPDWPMPEIIDEIMSEIDTLRAELNTLKRQPVSTWNKASKTSTFAGIEDDDGR